MAKVNRYTQLTGPQFDPLSFQKQSLVPMQLKKQQDALEEQAGVLGAVDAKRLAVDDPYVKEIIGEYEQEIIDYVERLQNEGFNNLSKQGLRDLARKRKELLSPTGALGKAEAAYNAFQANKKELGDMYKKGKISADKYQLGLQKALVDYNNTGGVANEGAYNSFIGVVDEDINKKARQIALDMQNNPKKLESLGFTSKRMADGTIRYYDTKTGHDYNEKGAIAIAVESLLKQDPNVINDLRQRKELGIINNPDRYIKGLANTYEALYRKDNRRVSRSGFFNPTEINRYKKELDKEYDEGRIDFEGYVTRSTDLYDTNVINTIDNIVKGKKEVDADSYIKHGDISILTAMWDAATGKAPMKPMTINKLSAPIKQQIEDIKTGLQRIGVLRDNADLNNPEDLAKVLTYMKDHQSVTTQPKLLTRDVRNSDKLAKHIINQGQSREFYDPKENKIYTYDEMIKKGYLSKDKKENYSNTTYRGQLTSDNNYSNMVESSARKGYVKPHVLKIGDKEFLVPGSMSELESPQSKEDLRFNKFWNHLKNTADIPSAVVWRNPQTGLTENVELMRVSKNSQEYAQYGTPYLMNRNGKVIPVTADTFRKMQGDLKLQ